MENSDGVTRPKTLILSEDISDSWKQWKLKFESYLSHKKLDTSEDTKRELLMCYIGERGCDILNTFEFSDADIKTPYTSAINKLDDYFTEKDKEVKQGGLNTIFGLHTRTILRKIRHAVLTLPKSTIFVAIIAVAIIVAHEREPACNSKTRIPREIDQRKIPDHEDFKPAVYTSDVSNADFGNQLMDTVLSYVRTIIRNKGLDRIPIPDFDESGFSGRNGWLYDTASIARKGNTNIRMEGPNLILDATLGLRDFRLLYDYSGEVGNFFYPSGTIRAQVGRNAVSISVAIDISTDNCNIYLRNWQIDSLGDIHVSLTGLGMLSLASETITDKMSEAFEKEIRYALNDIKSTLEQELQKFKCPS